MLDRSPPSALEASLRLCDMLLDDNDMFDKCQDPDPTYTLVQRRFAEYDPVAWMDLMACVNKEFGHSGKRWQWIMNNELSQGNAWVVDFYFEDPYDATMFQLKY